MYIQQEEILRLSKGEHPLLENFDEKNVNDAAYDLRVQKVHWIESGEKSDVGHTLRPGDSVYVSTVEDVRMPEDMLGFVIPRNSGIRMGLDISSPVYRPGHHTKIFVRVTNIADNEITLRSGDSVCSIMFYRLEHPVEKPYDGVYTEEFDFRGVNGTHSVQTAMFKAAEKAKDQVESVTKNIYATVLTLMSIFVAMFSVIIANANILPNLTSGTQVVFYNLILVGAISAFVFLVSLLLERVTWCVRGALAAVFVVCLCAAYWMASCM